MAKSRHSQERARTFECRLRGGYRQLLVAVDCPAAGLAVLASLMLVVFGLANAEVPDRWRPNPNIGLLTGLTIRTHWLENSGELREAARNSGQEVNQTDLKGFSILKRNRQTGEYVCDLYVVDMTGAEVDGDRTTTFGHEVLHCFGMKHE